MKRSHLFLSLLAGASLFVTAVPARAGVDVGVGGFFGGLGLGVGYHFGNYGRFGVGVHVDASRLGRRRERRPDDGRVRVRENVALKVSPSDVRVYLNGIQVLEDGRSEFTLPEGRHRLEFIRRGYRPEVVELTVQPGIDYRVERKLSKLKREETDDPRLDERARPVPVEDALRPAPAAAPRERLPEPRRDEPAPQSVPAAQPEEKR